MTRGLGVAKTDAENRLRDNLVFYQNRIPPLGSGNYQVDVEQTISSSDGKVPETTYQNINQFAVTGPRFALNPDTISSVYPPENASGEYQNVFAHVCFTRDTLPWERSVDSALLAQGAPMLADTPPWLAVLLIAQDDPTPDFKQVTLLDLLSSKYKTAEGKPGQLPEGFLFPGFPGADHNELEFGEKWTDPCLVVDLPIDLFKAIAPSMDDLKWLGHVREIQPSVSQSSLYMRKLRRVSTPQTPPRLSTVIANRLPAEGSESRALLVSVENWSKYLPQNDGTPSSNIPGDTSHVRMVVLNRWRFYAVALPQTFSGYLLNLNKTGWQVPGAFLSDPVNDGVSEADKAINNAFRMGLTPLNHHTRQGAKTVSWCHGPFVPFNIAGEIKIPVPGPDSVTRYNPDTGMFDVTYAAAWQLGRLLALQNSNFAETLYNWKRENVQSVISNFEAEMIKRTLLEIVQTENIPPPGDPEALRALVLTMLRQTLVRFAAATKASTP